MSDRVTRSAALWATVVAAPVAVLAGVLIFAGLSGGSAAAPRPSATSAPTTVAAVPSGPVAMAAPKLPAPAASACRGVLARLPAKLRDLPRREVSAGRDQNAAYGEPAITVACGVAQPPMCPTVDEVRPDCVPLDTELLSMVLPEDRICWYAKRGAAAATFTTMNRQIPVRVTVPAVYQQAAQWTNEFSPAVAAAGPRTTGVPSGCA